MHTKIGLTFGHSLRSILRHDPDIVLVGEIRDLETAENAIQASLTGHLVFSTLHTNDAASAFTRLIDMGVEPFLVASTVEGVMAQRLVRRLCPHCKRGVRAQARRRAPRFPLGQDRRAPMYRAVGCRDCRNTGYAGRMGIYELLVTTDKGPPAGPRPGEQLGNHAAAAAKDGMRTLRARRLDQGAHRPHDRRRSAADHQGQRHRPRQNLRPAAWLY